MDEAKGRTMLIRSNAIRIPVAVETVQCVVTSPPYWGLRDYGLTDGIGLEPTLDGYLENMLTVFREVKRVLREDGTLWLNLGDCYSGSWGSMSHDLDGKAKRMGYNARPASSYPQNGLKPKDLIGLPWRVAFALQADGWYLRSDIIWHKPNPMPESVRDRPTRSHEYVFLLTKRARYYYDADAVRENGTGTEYDRPKRAAGRMTGTRYLVEGKGQEVAGDSFGVGSATRNRRTVWNIATQSYRGAHFATFPEKLVEPCILAGSKPGDLVLDPFCGSGTTGAVAKRLGRDFVGLDMSAEYLGLAQKRIAAITMGMRLA